jgi:hypothetical protein
MEDTVHVTVGIHTSGGQRKWLLSSDPWSLPTFVRSLGPPECFQAPGDQLLHLGVDDIVFFVLSLNELEGVCGHARV